jgi:hypothetical protein
VVFNHFAQRVLIDSVTNPLSRQFGDKIIYFRRADAQAVHLADSILDEKRKFFGR